MRLLPSSGTQASAVAFMQKVAQLWIATMKTTKMTMIMVMSNNRSHSNANNIDHDIVCRDDRKIDNKVSNS